MVATGLWDHLREIWWQGSPLLAGLSEGRQTSLPCVSSRSPTLITSVPASLSTVPLLKRVCLSCFSGAHLMFVCVLCRVDAVYCVPVPQQCCLPAGFNLSLTKPTSSKCVQPHWCHTHLEWCLLALFWWYATDFKPQPKTIQIIPWPLEAPETCDLMCRDVMWCDATMRLCSAVACWVSVTVVLLGHKVELHCGVIRTCCLECAASCWFSVACGCLWNFCSLYSVLLHTGFYPGAKDFLMPYKHNNML